jgi:hypothetical protein
LPDGGQSAADNEREKKAAGFEHGVAGLSSWIHENSGGPNSGKSGYWYGKAHRIAPFNVASLRRDVNRDVAASWLERFARMFSSKCKSDFLVQRPIRRIWKSVVPRNLDRSFHYGITLRSVR